MHSCCRKSRTRMLHLRFWVAPFTSFVILASCYCYATTIVDQDEISYGTEVSWPMQHQMMMVNPEPQPFPTTNDDNADDAPPVLLSWLQQQQHERYASFMADCASTYTDELCRANDLERIELNARQPAWQHNFTSTGYAVVTLPTLAWDALEQFFWANEPYRAREYWEHGSIYTNHWNAPTYIVPFVPLIEQAVQTILEKWCGTPLIPTSTYGIRIYTNGSILTPHIDRVPLVISAIINVAQNVTEDWVLEVVGHSGRAVNLTLQPGEMVLYESHSVIHGRPYPLQGHYYANLMFHFEPVGYTQALARRMAAARNPKSDKELFHAALKLAAINNNNNQNQNNKKEQHNKNNNNKNKQSHYQPDLPYYIEEGTKEAIRWRQEFVFRRKILPPKPPFQVATTMTTTTTNTMSNHHHYGLKPHRVMTTIQPDRPHTVAARGDLTRLMELAAADASSMDTADANGWKPLHEAARAGRLEIVQYLIETHHVNVNERTNQGKGGSPLWWAEQSGNRDVVNLLKKHGAKAVRPEL